MNKFIKIPLEDYAEKIETIAIEYDTFAKEYDYYGYCDAVDDPDEYFKQLITSISNGDIQYMIDWLQEIVDEEDSFSAKAKILIDKLLLFK